MTSWVIQFGKSRREFYTPYHRDQFTRALTLNGTKWEMRELKGEQ